MRLHKTMKKYASPGGIFPIGNCEAISDKLKEKSRINAAHLHRLIPAHLSIPSHCINAVLSLLLYPAFS